MTQYYFNAFFSKGFVLDGFVEPSFAVDSDKQFQWNELPPAVIFRFKLPSK